jgi:hypothetical protein
MKENLEKIDTLLTLAFQESDGPFSVLIKMEGVTAFLIGLLSKEEILTLSKVESLIKIELCKRVSNRRWRGRWRRDRRK